MVTGLDIFKETFKEQGDCYVVIGGTACDLELEEAGLVARATKDIDIILVVEALTPEFGKQFWEFLILKTSKNTRQMYFVWLCCLRTRS